MRYEGNKVVVTESELRWLVNESVKNTLLAEVGNWAGVKNAWNGLTNGKFNVKKSFQTGKQAQTFQKYYNNAQKSITGMQQVLNNSNQPDLANQLQQVNGQLQQAANGFQQRAAQASGRQTQPQQQTPNANQQPQAAPNGQAKTIQMNPQQGGGNQKVAAAQAQPTSSFSNSVGKGIGAAAAGAMNFASGIKQGYNQNRIKGQQADNTAGNGNNGQINPSNPMTYVPAEYQADKNPQDTQGGYGYTQSPFSYDNNQQGSGQPQQQPKQAATPQDVYNGLDKEDADQLKQMQAAQQARYQDPTAESRNIRITQNDIRKLVKESLNILLNEMDGGASSASAAGGGALGGSNLMVGSSDESGGIAWNGLGKKKEKKTKVGGNPFNKTPILKQASPVGEPTNKTVNGVDMSDAIDRTGGRNHSIAMNHIDEAVDEGIGNWLKGAAVGGMMAMSPMQANAQTQNYQPQQNDSIQTQMQQAQKLTSQDLMKMFPQAYKDRNANAKVWFKNQKKYVAEVNGKISLVGKIAASHGQNPWDALLQKYCPEEYDSKIFSLSDFDIR